MAVRKITRIFWGLLALVLLVLLLFAGSIVFYYWGVGH